MATTNKAVARYRKKTRQKGVVRLEVQIPRQDAQAIRVLAGVLRGDDPALAERARHELAELARAGAKEGHLKELLMSAPLEGIEIERSRDTGRTVDLG